MERNHRLRTGLHNLAVGSLLSLRKKECILHGEWNRGKKEEGPAEVRTMALGWVAPRMYEIQVRNPVPDTQKQEESYPS